MSENCSFAELMKLLNICVYGSYGDTMTTSFLSVIRLQEDRSARASVSSVRIRFKPVITS